MSTKRLWFTGLRVRILLVVALPLAAMAVMCWVSLRSLGQLRTAQSDLTDRIVPASTAAYDVQLSFSGTIRQTRGVFLTTDSARRKDLLARSRRDLDKTHAAHAELEKHEFDEETKKVLGSLRTALQDFDRAVVPIWDMLAKDTMVDNEKAADQMDTTLPPIMRRLEKDLDTIAVKCRTSVGESREAAGAALTTVNKTQTWGLAAAMVVSAFFGLALSHSIYRSIARLVARVHAIARGDDKLADRVIEVRDRSELGELAESFNEFSHGVTRIVTQVESLTREVKAGSTTIAAASEEMSSTLKQQAEQVNEISSAVTSLTGAVSHVAEASAKASQASQEAGRLAVEGNSAVSRTIEGMKTIEQAVSSGAASVTELGKKSDQIGQIIKVIEEIADQTNLLALNATIEAARAGEHGRGFSVVADEVRQLASRTTDATTEVAKWIAEIQLETRNAVERMTSGTDQVRSGVELAGHASQSLSRIVKSVEESSSMISSIAAAIEEQRTVGDTIRERITVIVSGSEETATASQSSASTSAMLATKSQELERTLEEFTCARDSAATKVSVSAGG